MREQNSRLMRQILAGSHLSSIHEVMASHETEEERILYELELKRQRDKQLRDQRIHGMNARMYRANPRVASDVSHGASGSTMS